MYVHLDKMMSILLLLELTLVKYYATDCCLNYTQNKTFLVLMLDV